MGQWLQIEQTWRDVPLSTLAVACTLLVLYVWHLFAVEIGPGEVSFPEDISEWSATLAVPDQWDSPGRSGGFNGCLRRRITRCGNCVFEPHMRPAIADTQIKIPGINRHKPGVLTLGEPIVIGALDRSLINSVIERHQDQIRDCYDRELWWDPELHGKAKVKLVIAYDGTVSSARVTTSSLCSDPVHACIVKQFQHMHFPESKGNGIVLVSYPLTFATALL